MKTHAVMLRNTLLVGVFLLTALFVLPTESYSQITYSHEFAQGIVYTPGTPQYDDWINFRESLPEAGVNSIRLFGSNDSVGRSCEDSASAQIIADGLRNFDPAVNPIDTIVAQVECGGFLWRVENCSDLPNGVVIRVLDESDDLGVCSCSPTYGLGPAIFDGDWGGN